jgi:hypothetical protein
MIVVGCVETVDLDAPTPLEQEASSSIPRADAGITMNLNSFTIITSFIKSSLNYCGAAKEASSGLRKGITTSRCDRRCRKATRAGGKQHGSTSMLVLPPEPEGLQDLGRQIRNL